MFKIITLIVAMSSILYELTLAQLSSAFLGGTLQQYILTIGFYVFFLGVGSLYYGKNSLKINNKIKYFINLELILILSGVIFPLILYLSFDIISLIFLYIIVYSIISLIGFLSGIELPLLMDIFNDNNNSYSGLILAFDFFGTFFGTILFPLVLIPNFNFIQIPAIIGFLNLSSLFLIVFKSKDFESKIKFLIMFVFLIIFNLIGNNIL